MVCPEVYSHVTRKIEAFIEEDTRYKKHCTQDNDASVPFKAGTTGPHSVPPLTISCPVIFSWISLVLWNLFPFKGDFSFREKPEVPGCQIWAVGGTESFGWIFKKYVIYLFFREGEGREKEREKHQCVLASHAPPTGDLACNPGMCPDRESNWQLFGSQASTQSTEPHQPGPPGWFDVLSKNSVWDAMHEQVHCRDEAANHQLPIAAAFWIIWIVSMEECPSSMQNLMQILCSIHSVIWMLTQRHLPPPLTSTVKSSLFMHAHSSPLSLAARLHWCRANDSPYINNGWTFSGQGSTTVMIRQKTYFSGI